MKTLISASILSLGLFAGAAYAADTPKSVFMDIAAAVPSSATFMDLAATAPRSSIFDDINASAPRSDGVFGTLQTNAP